MILLLAGMFCVQDLNVHASVLQFISCWRLSVLPVELPNSIDRKPDRQLLVRLKEGGGGGGRRSA